ncbi:uncharacterized protein BX663DRAFT_483815 [Cokeromyces recurvatus]|uniref:uncharacterized protein n=1 Tax=Cokeromyces recurvatus TaxID=90255 RepID=UPI002220C532|nr:uncharacterized protein BX663DRAFT_483815 [Cokeromyces recurvatus]KAI7906190.1 hypothetical protein BX663DRAFT_483815 [Cokeromyces recurvatus]
MAQNILRSSTKTLPKNGYLIKAMFSSKTSGSWFNRFLTPAEEKKLYLGITSAFREKLIEQSNKSIQDYSHIIEHAISSTKPIILPKITKVSMITARMEQLKADLDSAGKQKDIERLQKLQLKMSKDGSIKVTIYNRLIRAYIWCDAVELAHGVLNQIKEHGLLPTTRTFIYLIQGYLKNDELNIAKELVKQMSQLSLLTLRTSFDCNVMMSYYQKCHDAPAIENLWHDIISNMDLIKPGPSLFIHYLSCLFSSTSISDLQQNSVCQTIRHFLSHQQDIHLNLHQYMTCIKAIRVLTSTNDKSDTQTAETLLFYLIKNMPTSKVVTWEKTGEAIQQIINSYLKEEQDLKIIAFYYKLRKSEHLPDKVFHPKTMQTINNILGRIEEDKANGAMTSELLTAEITAEEDPSAFLKA